MSALPVNTVPSFPSQSAYAPQPQPGMTSPGYPYGQDAGVHGWNPMTQQQQIQQSQQSQVQQQYLPLQPQQFHLQQQQHQQQQQQQHQQQPQSQMMQQPSFAPASIPSPSVLISAAAPVSVIDDDFEFSEFTSAAAAPSATSSAPVIAPIGVTTSSSSGVASFSDQFGDLSIGSNSVPMGVGMDDEMGDFMTADSTAQMHHPTNQPHSNNMSTLASASVDSTGTPRAKPSASEMMDNMLASMSTNILAPHSPPPSLKSLLSPSLSPGGDQASSPVVTPIKQQQRSSPRNDRMVRALLLFSVAHSSHLCIFFEVPAQLSIPNPYPSQLNYPNPLLFSYTHDCVFSRRFWTIWLRTIYGRKARSVLCSLTPI